ncbi:hypothetical protein HYT91_03630 [Candidatus Pacearchaeota archaeon]|nr:hypothetical protein [Candidatus Pacearchaeota archaeon]
MIKEYSLRYERDFVEGAKRFVKTYGDNFKKNALDYDKSILHIGEINHVAVIVSESSAIPNLTMIGLKELVEKTEKEIKTKKFKLKKC